jgi:hypothetical protein
VVAHLEAAISPEFHDHTLPPGDRRAPAVRRSRPANSGRRSRTSPARLEELVMAGAKVTACLRFTGTFTGVFDRRIVAGQRIDFLAFDVLAVNDGRVADNWHLEDNLTLMQPRGSRAAS